MEAGGLRRRSACRLGQLALASALFLVPPLRASDPRPNILWLSSEDNGPQLGAYGDAYAETPNLDRLAARGVRYTVAWSNAPVCAPARTAIISGLYPTSTGSQHMRSRARLPDGFRMFPQLLREAGYYTTNNAKEDYNLDKPGQVWDDSSRAAHWRNRPPGAPFFAVFNFETSHESQIRRRPHEARHDPARVRVPAYHPDVPEARRDWAQYYDKVSEMDAQVGERLRELEAAGLRDETIVFYWGDHGPGMPRAKRTPLDTGLRVPLVAFFPEKLRHLAAADYRAGGASDRLVAFVDLAPTLASLAGIEPPAYWQGRAFHGPYEAAPNELLFGFRGRMDERIDFVRSVRDRRYLYVRNYLPHLPYGQYVSYMFETETTRVWQALYEAGKLPPEQAFFWLPTKPPEELYDLEEDPDQVRNLAGSPDHREIEDRLHAALERHLVATRDTGFLPEAELVRRSAASTPWEMARQEGAYDVERLLALAELASAPGAGGGAAASAEVEQLVAALAAADPAERYWGSIGLLIRELPAGQGATAALVKARDDASPVVRIVAAECLARYGPAEELGRSLQVLLAAASLAHQPLFVVVQALNAIDALDDRAASLVPDLEALPTSDDAIDPKFRTYVPLLLRKILADLGAPAPAPAG